ncbi:hypothetical protein [Delftia tsuruhatensis]|uniref:hypothetical protein n=1 Tax=Delftia tsuruhatensis TaxID=180282 RepID=UPI003AEF5DBB
MTAATGEIQWQLRYSHWGSAVMEQWWPQQPDNDAPVASHPQRTSALYPRAEQPFEGLHDLIPVTVRAVHCFQNLHAESRPGVWLGGFGFGQSVLLRLASGTGDVRQPPGFVSGVRRLCGDFLQTMLRQKVMLFGHGANPTLAYDGQRKEYKNLVRFLRKTRSPLSQHRARGSTQGFLRLHLGLHAGHARLDLAADPDLGPAVGV